MTHNTLETLKRLIVDNVDVDESRITLNADFRKDLGADSLDGYALVFSIENEFGISIPDEKIEEFNTVRDLYNYIRCQKSHISAILLELFDGHISKIYSKELENSRIIEVTALGLNFIVTTSIEEDTYLLQAKDFRRTSDGEQIEYRGTTDFSFKDDVADLYSRFGLMMIGNDYELE